MVGNSAVKDLFQAIMRKHNAIQLVELDRPLPERDGKCAWGRDARVIHPNHVHLLPFPIPGTEILEDRLKPLLPGSDDRFIKSGISGSYGKGFLKEQAAAALAFARSQRIPYRRMRSAIEGGNCFIFFDPQERLKAIIGYRSLLLTFIGLEDQNYFASHKEDLRALAASITIPSRQALRAVGNMALYETQRKWEASYISMNSGGGSISSKEFKEQRKKYYSSLTGPVTEEDGESFLHEARLWDAKCILAKRVIAADIRVPIANIAFVPQTAFHIDMEMFVTPDGTRVGVDTSAYQRPLIKALAQIGCKAVPLPGVFGPGINFMNGKFVSTPKGTLFVTNGVKSEFALKRVEFQRAFQRAFPDLQIDFLDQSMQHILANHSGGIHCLTWEKPIYRTPRDIVASYLADEPMPETRLRAKLLEVIPSLAAD